MARTIGYFFAMNSPWAYLGHGRLVELARQHGAVIDYRPLRLGALFEQTGGLPLARRHEVRQRYRLVELQRWRAQRGLAMNLKPTYAPVDSGPADRLVLALLAAGIDPDGFMQACFTALWVDDRNIGDPAEIARIAAAAGVPDAVMAKAKADGDTVAARYEQNLTDARQAGVFGAPSYVVEGEIFWGQDRLELLGDMLTTGRAPLTDTEAR